MSNNTKYASFLMLLLIAGLVTTIPAHAQTAGPSNPNANVTTSYKLLQQESNQATISISTDKSSYNQGDTIVMTGHVSPVNSTTAITIRLFNSHQNLISVIQLLPSSDGSFTKTVLITGPLWQDAGTYTIVTQYGKYTQTNATFYYNGGDGSSSITKTINATYSLQSGSQVYNIPYIIKGGTVNSMNILANKFTLEISINTNADGSITITLPRALIDAKQNNVDVQFSITVNGNPMTQFSETQGSVVRILSIPFHNEDSKISITGTQVNSVSPSSSPVLTPLTPMIAPSKIPSWVKHIFIFYGQGQVSEDELLNALKFLIQQGILKVQ